MRRTMVVTISLTIVTLATLFGAKAVAASPSHSSKADAQDALIRNCTDYYNQRAWTYLQAHCYDTKSFIDHTP